MARMFIWIRSAAVSHRPRLTVIKTYEPGLGQFSDRKNFGKITCAEFFEK